MIARTESLIGWPTNKHHATTEAKLQVSVRGGCIRRALKGLPWLLEGCTKYGYVSKSELEGGGKPERLADV